MGWNRIPLAIENEQDRRILCSVLASVGLEVRIVKERQSVHGTYKKYVEYKEPTL